MEALRTLGGTLYTIYSFTIFALPIPFVLLYHGLIGWMSDRERLKRVYQSHRVWIRFWEIMTGTSFEVAGQEHIHPDQTYVFVVNHNNMLDIILVGSYIIHPWVSLVKKEITRIPLVGFLISLIAISVDRSSKESRTKSLLGMVKHLKKGISILIFPEGTRNRTPNPLKKFHNGAFNVAIQAQVPIIPVVIYNTHQLQPVNKVQLLPGKGNMRLLPPISTEGLSEGDIQSLKDEVFNQMYESVLKWDQRFADRSTNPTIG